ncbi:MAG: alkaline phosphatase [Tidjanibacter sp.]|nr:alkaline phosphatase [Tidjanibacter sp.]
MKRLIIKFSLALLATLSLAINANCQQITKGEIDNVVPQGSYTPSFANDGSEGRIDNIILMIGDGMGLAHLSAAMYANGGELTITNLRKCGFVRTQSYTHFTTDSAASGTAYATGSKTHNKAIGVDKDDRPIENIVDRLSDKGYATGIVTTDFIDGATPSAFFAHQKDRGMSVEIWSDLPGSKLNLFAGGCRDAFEALPQQVQSAIGAKFQIVNSLDNVPTTNKLGYLPERGETASVNDPKRGDFLPATTRFAIDRLGGLNKRGFFLMVEGARIDKSSHDNDFQAVVRETLDFDKAVEAAIRFAEKDGHTLVIISADHETGALALRKGDIQKGYVSGTFSSEGHTPIMVPLFAFGPYSDRFCGIQENSDVSNKIYQLLTE